MGRLLRGGLSRVHILARDNGEERGSSNRNVARHIGDAFKWNGAEADSKGASRDAEVGEILDQHNEKAAEKKQMKRRKHRHRFKLTDLTSLGKEFQCKCGKIKTEFKINLACSYQHLVEKGK